MNDGAPLRHRLAWLSLAAALSLSVNAAHHNGAQESDQQEGEAYADPPADAKPLPKPLQRDGGGGRYTFSWLFGSEAVTSRPRGGTTVGPAIELVEGPTQSFLNVTSMVKDGREKDRQAILALAGAYRTSFDFLEVIGFTADYSPPTPYQSWGTEYVYVVANEPDFVSLQHILVMRIVMDDESVSDPFVIKHWRHDWRCEDRDLHEYVGFQTWEHKRLPRRAVKGTWSHAVYQVDDSPRYETIGRWTHEPGYSHFESERMYRPLPRREFSVRDDYHALDGTVRFTLTPTGWVMQEDALKLVLNEDGSPRTPLPYLAREVGVSRYERIQNYDFGAGDEYWAGTGPFWSGVRDYWSRMYDQNERIAITKTANGKPMFVTLFEMADQYQSGALKDDALDATITEALAPYWVTGD